MLLSVRVEVPKFDFLEKKSCYFPFHYSILVMGVGRKKWPGFFFPLGIPEISLASLFFCMSPRISVLEAVV